MVTIFLIVTSSRASLMPNDVSFDSVFCSASIGARRVAVASSFRLLPVSALPDFRFGGSIFGFWLMRGLPGGLVFSQNV